LSGYDRRTALIGRGQTLARAEAPFEDFFGIADLPATGAGEIATKKRLQHQDQGIAPFSPEPLAEHILGDPILLNKRYTHILIPGAVLHDPSEGPLAKGMISSSPAISRMVQG
jgi:hypothetical protein